MNRCIAIAALMLVTVSGRAQAQTQTLYSPVILGLASDGTTVGTPFQIMPDGTAYQNIAFLPVPERGSLKSDLSRVRFNGSRYFLAVEGNDPVAYNESDSRLRTVLTSDPSLSREDLARWSLDGTKVAFPAKRYDSAGLLQEQGLYVGDVYTTDGVPTAIVNERIAVSYPLDYGLSFNSLSWMSDNQRIVYNLRAYLGGKSLFDCIFVADLSGGGLASVVQLSFGQYPIACPVAGDNRIMYQTGGTNFDTLWTVVVPPGYDGSYSLTAKQITNSKNAKCTWWIRAKDWSPDGQYLLWSGYPTSRLADVGLYKIKADGTGAQVTLLEARNVSYWLNGWRP